MMRDDENINRRMNSLNSTIPLLDRIFVNKAFSFNEMLSFELTHLVQIQFSIEYFH